MLVYDQKPAEEYRPVRRLRQNVVPTSRAAAQAKLDEKKAAEDESEEPYVYLPPGSSMR